MTKIIAKVITQKGTCEAGHKVGNEFILDPVKTPAGLCPWAYSALFTFGMTLQYGGAFPWEKNPDKARVSCPDPDNPVVFELTRVSD